MPGVKHISLTHGTLAPVVRDPEMLGELQIAVDKSLDQHRASTHHEKRYQHMFIGLGRHAHGGQIQRQAF